MALRVFKGQSSGPVAAFPAVFSGVTPDSAPERRTALQRGSTRRLGRACCASGYLNQAFHDHELPPDRIVPTSGPLQPCDESPHDDEVVNQAHRLSEQHLDHPDVHGVVAGRMRGQAGDLVHESDPQLKRSGRRSVAGSTQDQRDAQRAPEQQAREPEAAAAVVFSLAVMVSPRQTPRRASSGPAGMATIEQPRRRSPPPWRSWPIRGDDTCSSVMRGS